MRTSYVLGIDVGGTTTKLALVRAGDEPAVIGKASVETRPAEPAAQLIERVTEAARPLLAAAPQPPVGIGVGCPGLIDHRHGIVVLCSNIPKLGGFALRDELSKALKLPCEIQNDANATAVGEFLFGQGRGVQNLIVLTLGTGVGGGVIADGKLLSGAENAAGELGHIKVDFSDSAAPCGCGKSGCIEAYGGIAGIQRIARRRVQEVPGSTALNIEELTTKKITEAAHAGDAVARGTLFEVGTYLGRGIANLIETFNPEKVVLSGGASAATDFLLPGIKVSLNRHCCFDITRDRTIIERSSIADAVGFLGPAAVFLAAREGVSP